MSNPDEFTLDPLEDNNYKAATLIHLARIYDLLLANLLNTSPDTAKMIQRLHSEGEFFGPPPAFLVAEDS